MASNALTSPAERFHSHASPLLRFVALHTCSSASLS